MVAGFLTAARLCLGVAARTEHALQPRGADRAADGRSARVARADRRRRLGGARRGRRTSPSSWRRSRASRRRRRALPSTSSGWYDGHGVEYGIRIPKLLSLLAFHDPNAEVKGLDTVPADQRPPVNVVRFAFQAMVAIGTALALLGVVFVGAWFRLRRLPASPWFYRAVVAAGPLSFVALIAGWITTEVGRQPWIVYRVMRTSEAVTGASGIPIGYVTLALVYAGSRGRGRMAAAAPRARADGAARADAGGCGRGGSAWISLRYPSSSCSSDWPPTRCSPAPISAPASGSSWAGGASGDRRAARPRAPRHGPRLGGQPRLADLRAGGLLDGLSDGLRIDHVDARDSVLRRGIGIILRGTAYALRSGAASPREQRTDRGRLRRLLDPHPLCARRGDRRHRFGPRPGRQRQGRPLHELAQPDVDHARRDRRRDIGVPGGRLPGRRRGAHRPARPRGGVPHARARHGGRRRRRGDRRARGRAQRRAPDLGRSDERRRDSQP